MSFLGGALGVVTSIMSGGLTGILGAGLQRFADFKNKQQDIEILKLKGSQDLAMRELDGKLMNQEWANRLQVTSVEAEARKDVADSEAFKAAMWKEPDRYSAKGTQSGWLVALDVFRGIIRPGLTLYLCALTTMMYLECQALIKTYGMVMDSNQVFDIYSLIINTVLYLTTTAVLFWFGTRNKGKQPGTK